MKVKGLVLCASILTLICVNSFAQHQEKRFGFEFRPNVSFATRTLGDADLNMGKGFEGIFHYQFMPQFSAYVGWGWHHFAAEESFAGNDMDFEETGYVFGLQYDHPIGDSPLDVFLRAGGVYNHIEIENDEGDIVEDTGHGLGWQIASGVDIPIGSNWSVAPSVKFQALSRDLENGPDAENLDLNYLSVGVGIVKAF